MRHRKKSERFSRSRAQRKALIKSLLRAIIINERIITVTSKAKFMRAEVDKLITWAKKGSVFYRRLAYGVLDDHKLVKRLFEAIGPRFVNINGGYTRVLRLGNRKGDGASLSLLELTRVHKMEKVHRGRKVKGEEEVILEQDKEAARKDKKTKKGIISGVKNVLKKGRKLS